ncbi:MAG: hypothetical protein QOG89_1530 [Thermomicrobiales bacterium]|nr:hypothetical protein [Thermomicrobiales bacterium]
MSAGSSLSPTSSTICHSVGDAYEDRGEVFVNETGGHLHPKVLSRRYGSLIARAGVPTIRFHDLRHTSATLMLAEGAAACRRARHRASIGPSHKGRFRD